MVAVIVHHVVLISSQLITNIFIVYEILHIGLLCCVIKSVSLNGAIWMLKILCSDFTHLSLYRNVHHSFVKYVPVKGRFKTFFTIANFNNTDIIVGV